MMVLECNVGKLHFTLKVKSNLTAILGDSGSGKTLFAKALKNKVVAEHTIDNYCFFDYSSRVADIVDSIQKSVNKIFIIDNADLLLQTNINWARLLHKNNTNTYLIFTRDPFAFGIPYEGIARLVRTGNCIQTVYTSELDIGVEEI